MRYVQVGRNVQCKSSAHHRQSIRSSPCARLCIGKFINKKPSADVDKIGSPYKTPYITLMYLDIENDSIIERGDEIKTDRLSFSF